MSLRNNKAAGNGELKRRAAARRRFDLNNSREHDSNVPSEDDGLYIQFMHTYICVNIK